MTPHEQTHFLDQFQRKLTPDSDRPEPVLWFKEIRILDSLTDPTKKPIRAIKLHRGLNILWAKPENPVTEQGLYRDGLAGHASGKTLFCRLIRHVLGEKPFGTESQRLGIASNFFSLWVVAAVRIDGIDWVVGRRLATEGSDFALASDSIDSVIGENSPTGGYEDFLSAVKAVAAPVADQLHPGEGWRHLLGWLMRDQEARFANIAAWRDPSSEGDNPQSKAAQRHLLMRAVLGLLDMREPTLRAEIDTAQGKLETEETKIASLQTEAATKLDQALRSARKMLGDSAPGDIDALKARVESLEEVLQQGIVRLESEPESPEVKAARERDEEAGNLVISAKAEVEKLTEKIQTTQERQKQDLLLVRDFENGNMEDPIRKSDGWCPKTKVCALENGCITEAETSPESIRNIAELKAAALALTSDIDAFQRRKEARETELPTLRNARIETQKALQIALRHANREILALATRVEKARGVRDLFSESDSANKSLGGHETTRKQLLETIEQKKQDVTALRASMDTKLRVFTNSFADIVRAVMGASVEASITLESTGIAPHVTRKRELSGAALDTIKTLAFDLAAIVISMEGHGTHPRFLVHDGPREGDMARIIYERFFIYATELEKNFPSPADASFQYIITTTTEPPPMMQDGSRWLLLPVLNSSDPSTRLFGVDF